jgi:ubiquinone/menaquinone biosynthesis C-methylase UbiE
MADTDEARARLLREIEHHRRIAPIAERFWSWTTPSGARRAARRARIFVEEGRIGPSKRVLEIGCGTGVFLEMVAASGANLHGIDLSVDLLSRAAERARSLPNVRLHRGNVEQLPFPDGTFDTVYGSSILHHLHLLPALREIFRVLRPGGRAVFTEPNIINPQVAFMFHFHLGKEYFGVSPDEMAFSRFRARRSLNEVGFADVVVTPFDFLHPSVPRSLLNPVESLGKGLERTPLREIAGSLLMRGDKPPKPGGAPDVG